MAFPDDPQGTPVPSDDTAHTTREPEPHVEPQAEHVAGEVLTDAPRTKYDETQSYSDSWSSSYGDQGTVTQTPPVAALPPAGGGKRPPDPPKPEEDDDEEGMTRMSFLEHLEELRTRILRALGGMGVAFLACLFLGPQLWNVIQKPAHNALLHLHQLNPNVRVDLVLIDPMDGFQLIWMKIPLLCAIFVASPWVLYQLWAFISPGLYKKEKRWAVPFVVSSSALFIIGGFFAYFVVFRYGLEFLLGIGLDYGITPGIDVNKYYDLFVDVMLGVSVIFEIPVMLFLLTLIHVVSPSFLIKHSRYAILGIVVLAAVITPTGDIFNLSLFATPMILLFYLGIFASYLLVLHREKRKFPWATAFKWIGIGLVVILAILIAAAIYYKYHYVNHWPYLIR